MQFIGVVSSNLPHFCSQAILIGSFIVKNLFLDINLFQEKKRIATELYEINTLMRKY